MGSDPTNKSVAVASHSFPKNPTLRRELLARYPSARFNDTGSPLKGADLLAFLSGCDKAITGLEVLDDTVFRAVPEIRIVSKYGVGLDMIDLAAARRHGVSIRWTPGVNRQAVAELTLCFMIALCRSVVPLASELAAGGWRRSGGRELSSCTVGIVGCRCLGQRVARLSRAFGATVLAHDTPASEAFYRGTSVTPVTLGVLPRASDVLTNRGPRGGRT